MRLMPEDRTRYGFPLAEWRAAVRQTRNALAEAAASRRTITYGELCRAVDIDVFPRSWALLALIDEACGGDEGFARGTHPASLVVRASDGMPGEGYFAWAERAGFDVGDRRAFWESEVKRVFEAFCDERESA